MHDNYNMNKLHNENQMYGTQNMGNNDLGRVAPNAYGSTPIDVSGLHSRNMRTQIEPDDDMSKFRKKLEQNKLCLNPETYEWHNVPTNLLHNQFGLLSFLLSTMLPEEKRILTHGIDLSTLGLPNKMDSGKNIHFFSGPFGKTPKDYKTLNVNQFQTIAL